MRECKYRKPENAFSPPSGIDRRNTECRRRFACPAYKVIRHHNVIGEKPFSCRSSRLSGAGFLWLK
ncbi:hypothetical protein A464_4035 [Salmonella bongori N268-08]|uniref:Uncharacterized protein n=1 Tax=Salmonella bongori N268-08 TaxID=1197719 RepID=S5N2U6_SALBN|nr:hypothetical protein A464_4035 [Salmonella bongori N268-08]